MGVAGLCPLISNFMTDVAIGALIADKLQRSSNKSDDEVPRQDPVIELGVDASCPLHNLLHRHAKDIILRSSRLSFRASVKQLLLHYISWAATKNNPAAAAAVYSQANPGPFLLMVCDGARLTSKLVNARRSEDRSKAQKTLLENFDESEEQSYYSIDEKTLSQAIGGYNIQAMDQFIEVCNELGVRWEIAPCEAEHQLCYLQMVGCRVKYILTYDSDLIAAGASNVFLDTKHHMHQGMVKYFSRPSKLMDGDVLKKLQMRHIVELEKQKQPILSGQKKNKVTAAATQEFLLAEILMRDGFRFVEIARCILRSDYNYFPSVGSATLIRLYRIMLQTREDCTLLVQNMSAEEVSKATHEHIQSMTVREIFSKMATLLNSERLGLKKKTASADHHLPDSFSRVQDIDTLIENALQVDVVQGAAEPAQDSAEAVQGAAEPEPAGAAESAIPKSVTIHICACPCCSDSFLPGRHLTERDMVMRMEAAWIMFRYSLVRSTESELITLHPINEQTFRDELQFHSIHELNIHIGRVHFTGINLHLFASGAYDVRDLTLKQQHPIVRASEAASTDCLVLIPERPVLLMFSDLPSESEIYAMTVMTLEKWLKNLKKPHSVGLKEEKRDRLLSAVKMCRAIGILPDDAGPTEHECQVIGKAVTDAYACIDEHRTDWKSAIDTHDDLLHAIRARETASEIKILKSARTKLCICFAGAACSDDLSLRPSNRVPLNKSLSAIWLKVICPNPTAAQRRRLKNSKDLRLDRRHFRYDQLICVGDSERVTVRPGCVPSRLHVPFEYQWSDTHNLAAMVPITEVTKIHDRTSCVDLYDMGNLRKAVFDIQQAGVNLSVGVSILQEFVQERVQLALISATSAAVMNVEPPALPPVHVNVVLGFVQDDPHYCRTHTGEPSWISILAQFKYIDADNAISSMHVTFTRRPDKSKLTAETDTSKVASMRKRTLISPLHQFAVFLLMAKSFLSDVETLAKSFNITERIAFRYYDAHCAAFSYLQLYHQPVPTYGEMVVATPTIMRNVAVSHGAPPGSAVIASDCSEVKLNRAENVEVFSVTYSVYKGGNTVKVPTFALGTGYLFPLTLTGPCDDDEVLKASGIASTLFQAMERARTGVGVDREADILISMLYDKGLSNWTFLEKMGIFVLCPDKAKPKQMIFGQKSSRTCRELASGRIIIENVHAVLKEYAAFANTKRLDRLDMTLHEFNAVRFLINTQPVINNWTSLSQHSFERDTDAVLHRPDLPMGKCGCALCKSKKSS